MEDFEFLDFVEEGQVDSLDGVREDFSDFFNVTGKSLFVDDQTSRGVSKRDANKAWRNASRGVKDLWQEKAKSQRKEDRKERKEERKEDRDERKARVKELGLSWPAVQAKRVALAPSRGAFIALLMLNFRGFAARINAYRGTAEEVKFEKQWLKLGGDWEDFLNAVDKGKGKKPLICGAKCKSKLPSNFSGFINFSSDADGFDLYNYPTGAEETAATAATAYPVLSAIGGVLAAISTITGNASDVANDIKDAVEGEEKEDDADMTPEEKAAAEKKFNNAGQAAEEAANAAASSMVDNKLLLFVGVALIAVLLLKRK